MRLQRQRHLKQINFDGGACQSKLVYVSGYQILEADLAEDSAALPFIERRAERETASNIKY